MRCSFMSEKKKKVSVIYKILIIILCLISIMLNLELAPLKKSILYFTFLSNLECFIFYIIALILYMTKKLKKNNIYYIFKGLVTINITLTMAVYNFVLNGSTIYANHMLACNFEHIIVPLSVILDYIVFGEKGNLKKMYPLIWGMYLIVYTAIVEIYSMLGGMFDGSKVPYFYMDADKYGTFGVLRNCLFIYIAFIAYAYFVVYLDKKAGKNKVK